MQLSPTLPKMTAHVAVRHEVDQESVPRMFESLAKPVIDVSLDTTSGETARNRPQIEAITGNGVANVVDLVPPATGNGAETTSPNVGSVMGDEGRGGSRFDRPAVHVDGLGSGKLDA